MKKNTHPTPFITEALANLKLLFSFLLHIRKSDDFIGRHNIKSVL
jgi:hypothetical protein